MTSTPDTSSPDAARRDHGYHRLSVKAVIDETADTRSYVLDVPASLQDTFTYRPGQFCTFRVQHGDAELLRCYSMSSAPETDSDLTVTVKRVPDGAVSNWFNDGVRAGDVLEVSRPTGSFVLRAGVDSDEERPVLGFCGGSGVTPVISIAKSALASTQRPVRLLYANRDVDSVIFQSALETLVESSDGRLEVQHHLDSDGGFLTASDIATFVGPNLDVDVFICGPTPFMDLVESTIAWLGVAPDRISIERFGGGTPAARASTAADEVPDQVTIILKGKRTTIDYQPGDTILETGRRGGLTPPFSCESGNCASCMALVKKGTVTMRANEALSASEIEEGWVLTCQGLPSGTDPVVVEYENL